VKIYIPETVLIYKDSKFNASGVSASQMNTLDFKLYGDHFRLYSMTWDSKTYLCFEKPQFYCSFKANYAGGRIPSKTDVTPWAFVSNFCDKKTECCTYNYIPTAPMQFEQGIYSDSTVMVWASCERDGLIMFLIRLVVAHSLWEIDCLVEKIFLFSHHNLAMENVKSILVKRRILEMQS
jgi:hypothetical protein